MYGGEGGIRTPDSLATMSDFESGAFNRALPPLRLLSRCESDDCKRVSRFLHHTRNLLSLWGPKGPDCFTSMGGSGVFKRSLTEDLASEYRGVEKRKSSEST